MSKNIEPWPDPLGIYARALGYRIINTTRELYPDIEGRSEEDWKRFNKWCDAVLLSCMDVFKHQDDLLNKLMEYYREAFIATTQEQPVRTSRSSDDPGDLNR